MNPSDPTVVAVARLKASRAHLRAAIEARRPKPEADDDPGSQSVGDGLAAYWRTAQRMVRRGWHKHPWRPWVGMAQGLVEPAARSMIAPIARDRPVLLMAGAACVGALFMATRPWRWLAPKAVAAGVGASFAAASVRALINGPFLTTLVDALTPREQPAEASLSTISRPAHGTAPEAAKSAMASDPLDRDRSTALNAATPPATIGSTSTTAGSAEGVAPAPSAASATTSPAVAAS